jgi:hypothetical protein
MSSRVIDGSSAFLSQIELGAEYSKSCYTRRYMTPEKEKGRHDGRP